MSTTLNLIDLRDGDARDLPVVDRIMQAAFDPRFGEAWTAGQTGGMLSLPGVSLTIASIADATTGFALMRSVSDECELLLLATEPRYRGRGVGRALLRSVIATAVERGAAHMHLEVRSNNDATRLYHHEGFVKCGERRNYYRGNDNRLYDAHTYRKSLGLVT